MSEALGASLRFGPLAATQRLYKNLLICSDSLCAGGMDLYWLAHPNKHLLQPSN